MWGLSRKKSEKRPHFFDRKGRKQSASRKRVLTFTFDRGIYDHDVFEQIIHSDRYPVVTWQKGYRSGGMIRPLLIFADIVYTQGYLAYMPDSRILNCGRPP